MYSTTFKLIKSLASADLESKSFDQLAAPVKNHYDLLLSPIVKRYQFNERKRAPNESIAAYLAACREIAQYCEFGESLPEMLRDRLVHGVNHEAIQKKLLSEKDLTYEKALSLAQSIEASEKHAKYMKTGFQKPPSLEQPLLYTASSTRLHAPSGSSNRTPVTCYGCGGNHLAPVCRHKDSECHTARRRVILLVFANPKLRAWPHRRAL